MQYLFCILPLFYKSAVAAAAKLLQWCLTLRPQRRQPSRLPRPWDSPGKNTGVGCHFLLQCIQAKSESEVAQLCPTLRNPMDCSLPGSSVHGICQARVLEWVSTGFFYESEIISKFKKSKKKRKILLSVRSIPIRFMGRPN